MNWKKATNIVALAALAFGVIHYRQKAEISAMQAGWMKRINDSTTAMTAARDIDRKEFAALLDAAKSLKGKAVAGVTFHTKADTTVRQKEVVDSTVIGPDSSRSAVLEDTTKLGIKIRIEAEAPRFPQPLKLGYSMIVPDFKPTVGFVRTGDTYAATVTWAGQSTTIDKVFYIPQSKEKGRTTWALKTGSTVGGDEGIFRKPDWNMSLERRFGAKGTVYSKFSVSPYDRRQWTLGYEKTLLGR